MWEIRDRYLRTMLPLMEKDYCMGWILEKPIFRYVLLLTLHVVQGKSFGLGVRHGS